MTILNQRRKGMTRVEIVVTVLIAMLFVGVVLSGLPQLWSYSRRVQCEFHLKTLGESTKTYVDQTGSYPPSMIADRYASWAVVMAPYLPPASTKSLTKWDLKKSYYEQEETIRQAQVGYFYCPARRRPPQLSTAGDVPGNGLPEDRLYPGALGDYAACVGNGSGDTALSAPNAKGALIIADVEKQENGKILEWKGRVRKSDLEGKQSYTFLIGEKHVPLEKWGKVANGDGSLYNGEYPLSFSRFAGPEHLLAQSPESPVQANFGSYHPGVCLFLVADGSVRTLNVNTSGDVLSSLATRD